MLVRLALAGGIVALAPALAFAQNFPTKPITLILPYAAGGNTDAIARTIAHNLEQRLGQSVVVETRLGAASVCRSCWWSIRIYQCIRCRT
jgi:tripartite-type tricarboxylate transporter receptor subunit TctC